MRLFVAYAALSLAVVTASGVVLVHGARQDARASALRDGRTQAAVIQQMVLAPALRGVVLDDVPNGHLSDAQLDQLRHADELALAHSTVIRLRVRDSRGAVLFADDGQLRSPISYDDPLFTRALDGHTTAVIVAAPEMPGGHVVRVVGPVRVLSTDRSGGIFEADLPYAAVQRAIDVQVRHTVTRLAACLALLWAALAGISWSTTRRLRGLLAERAHEALHDQLTGLPNRAAMHEALQDLLTRPEGLPDGATAAGVAGGLARRWVASSRRLLVERRRTPDPTTDGAIGRAGAVALVDLDGFKAVNDQLGHIAGDRLLQVTASGLRAALRPGDVAARLGGDEFGLILAGLTTPEAAAAVGRRLTRVLTADVHLGASESHRAVPATGLAGRVVRVGASVGVTLLRDLPPAAGVADQVSPADVATTADLLLHRADAAMYAAKRGRADVLDVVVWTTAVDDAPPLPTPMNAGAATDASEPAGADAR